MGIHCSCENIAYKSIDFHSHVYTVSHVNIVLFVQKTRNKKVGIGETGLCEGIIVRRI